MIKFAIFLTLVATSVLTKSAKSCAKGQICASECCSVNLIKDLKPKVSESVGDHLEETLDELKCGPDLFCCDSNDQNCSKNETIADDKNGIFDAELS